MQALPVVAQYAMDQFYQNYRSNTDFFELKDFIFHCGSTLAAAFQQGYTEKYAEMRADRQEEVISFSHDWLAEQDLKVDRNAREPFVKLIQHPMSFPFDQQDTGIQEVFALSPWGTELERSSITEVWQQKYYPATNRIFWWLDRDKIRFYNKGGCNIETVRVLYVPQISEDMQVPDALVDMAVVQTVARMKQIAEGVVIKKSLDGNDNKILQTELNGASMKP